MLGTTTAVCLPACLVRRRTPLMPTCTLPCTSLAGDEILHICYYLVAGPPAVSTLYPPRLLRPDGQPPKFLCLRKHSGGSRPYALFTRPTLLPPPLSSADPAPEQPTRERAPGANIPFCGLPLTAHVPPIPINLAILVSSRTCPVLAMYLI